MHGGLGILYPINFCIVGMVLAVRLKIIPTVDCYIRLCTKTPFRTGRGSIAAVSNLKAIPKPFNLLYQQI